MKISGLIWLEDIIDKLFVKHEVEEYEVKEVLGSRPLFRFVEKDHKKGEDVYVALGQTEAGRYLIVYFVYKRDKRAIILSARNMSKAERRLYAQR